MNCIIIDDENHCIKTLTRLLETDFREVKVLATCLDSTKAYNLIQEYKPDFIFLDIEMPLLNGFDLLSKRELEVVRSLAEGLTNREIAEKLGLSQHTVKNYLFRVFDKLGVSSRVELLFMTLSQAGSHGL